MISIKPKFDGSNGIEFQCTKNEELDYLNSHVSTVLNKFVETRIKNIGEFKIKSFKEYVDFCTADPKTRLEKIVGHKIKSEYFGRLEIKDSFILSNEITKGLSFTKETIEDLQNLANQMFEDFQIKKIKRR